SIHAPRAGRDPRHRCQAVSEKISIHAPRAGRDLDELKEQKVEELFQSTRPVRGATEATEGLLAAVRISIHAPRAGRDQLHRALADDVDISIHAPRAGRDSKSIQNYFTHFCDKRQFLDNFTQNAAF
uniref:hypothetical protein n=1 Tax=Dysosmobacter sp. TaxID=2591382 RepID=UPI003AEFF458